MCFEFAHTIETCTSNITKKAEVQMLRLFFAPLMFEILNLWEGFKEVVKFIDNNRVWLDALMGKDYLYRTNNCRYGE